MLDEARSSAALFDVIVIVDWSAQSSAKRGADSIWSYELDAALPAHGDPINHPTRAEAREHLVSRLQRHATRTVLLGFDFPLGYPAGFAAAAGLLAGHLPPWAATWQHLASTIADDIHNRNNRWAVAAGLNERLGHHRFWGSPPAYAGRHLPMHKPLPAHPDRAIEQRLRAHGLRPFSTWQLLGAGSVGSQALTGIPVAHHLRHHPALSQRTRVWPFETGLTAHPTGGPGSANGAIVIAEIWPSAIDFGHVAHDVKDARQVMALADHLGHLDHAGALAARFRPRFNPATALHVVGEEGWVLPLR